MLLILWLGICGTILIYDNPAASARFSQMNKLSLIQWLFLLQFILITLPLSILYVSNFRLAVLIGICFLGWLYSKSFDINGNTFRVKDTLFIKNIFIGLGWGLLVIVGAGTADNKMIMAVFLFTSLQISVGSIIRDISDVENDTRTGMRTMPIVFGIHKTITILQVLNLLTFFPPLLIKQNWYLVIFMLTIITWKWIVLMKVKTTHQSSLWTQTLNILTCSLIFIFILVHFGYELYL
jgi:4-hydroxybenzoate polyprenyltransferase